MQQELPGALREAAGVLARFLGARGDDLVFVENPPLEKLKAHAARINLEL